MKKHKIFRVQFILMFLLALCSCESYLERTPESQISDKEIYGSFKSFQGFTEELYNCITDYNKCGAWNQYLFADETLNKSSYASDLGNYWSMTRPFDEPSIAGGGLRRDLTPKSKRIWPLCWYGIRKANLGLTKLNLLVDATQEEKDIIKGQLLFFRGWFHFELMRYWGGLPYIDTLLYPDDNLRIPRLNYRETALMAAKDLEAAAKLLPVDWDKTKVGQNTLGNNRQRINKVFALGFLGKDLLYAASPMMNEESTGSNTYDQDLCKRAATVFGEVLRICDSTGVYKLQSWDTWTDNFWVWSPNNMTLPGGTEVIMNPTVYDRGRVRWSTVCGTSPFVEGYQAAEVPTNNYIKNYAMANGLPIDDPNSGYNPNDPWTGREPRFYKDIIIDGDTIVISSTGGDDRTAQLYTGGRHRKDSGGVTKGGSVTGFYYKRFSPIGCNPFDNSWNYFQAYIPYLRLADVYLMYAEAVYQGYGKATDHASGYVLTAEQAMNIIRNRAQLPNLAGSYTTGSASAYTGNPTNTPFMNEIIRERAVELGFEAHRFCDLRRWNLNGETKYRQKTAIDFDRGVNGKPINLSERVVITRVVEKKHNWLPFRLEFTTLYPEFQQNPGW